MTQFDPAAGLESLDLRISARAARLLEEARSFIAQNVLPVEDEYFAEVERAADRWRQTPRMIQIMSDLKREARSRGLWNLFLPIEGIGAGLTAVEYAHFAEATGASFLAAEAFNCSAPDSGNMELLARYGTEMQRERWLVPLLDGDIRSAYAMTEPDVASSDATNISLRATLEGDEWLLDGEKHYISGAGDTRCRVLIVMALTDPDAARHQRHSQILVPIDTPGLQIVRPMQVFGQDDAPHGHMHLRLCGVRVPLANLILGRGRGFEIAQGRLGPGRIHHCMRAIGQAERALQLLCRRGLARRAFGKPLAELGANFDIIAEARIEIEMARLLTLRAAYAIDTQGPQSARHWISMIKVAAPRIALRVIDEAMQMHGALGLSQDTPLPRLYALLRSLRFADGPDAVHRRQIGRAELRRHAAAAEE